MATRVETAEINKLEAETEHFKKLTEKTDLENFQLADVKRKQLASLDENRIYPFNGPVGSSSVDACISYLGQWHREDPSRPIKIVFNSPGGAVHPGLALFDFIKTLQDTGTQVDTESIGWAASMAGILLQAGQTRRMGPNAFLLIHEIQAGAIGNMSEIEDEVKFLKQIQARVVAILAERSELTERQIRRRWKKTDWWLDADQALKFGFIDEIG